jgi:hypothetical protein
MHTEEKIEHLVARFRDHSLPPAEWTHEAHLVLGLYHVYHYPLEKAIYDLRAGIITYNLASGGQNTIERGYHETITQFWARLMVQFIEKQGRNRALSDLSTIFLNSPLADQQIMFEYYSKELLFSANARALYVEPDLKAWRVKA